MDTVISESKRVLQGLYKSPKFMASFISLCNQIDVRKDLQSDVLAFIKDAKFIELLDGNQNMIRLTDLGEKFISGLSGNEKEKEMLRNRSSWWPLYSQIRSLGENDSSSKDQKTWLLFFALLILAVLAYLFIRRS